MEEISPAASLLNRAATVSPSDYARAKNFFLEGLQNAGIQAQVRGVSLSSSRCALHEEVQARGLHAVSGMSQTK